MFAVDQVPATKPQHHFRAWHSQTPVTTVVGAILGTASLIVWSDNSV